MALDDEFKQAADDMSNKVNKTLSNDELLELYGLYKQASVGDVNTERPGFFDMKGKAKHDAWTARKGMPQEEAMQKYIDLTKSMMEKHGTIN